MINIFLNFLKISSHLKIKHLIHMGVYIMSQINEFKMLLQWSQWKSNTKSFENLPEI